VPLKTKLLPEFGGDCAIGGSCLAWPEICAEERIRRFFAADRNDAAGCRGGGEAATFQARARVCPRETTRYFLSLLSQVSKFFDLSRAEALTAVFGFAA